MATNFPTSLDVLTNPTAGSSVESPSHSQQHSDANDAIEALEAKVGADNSTVTTSLDYRVRTLESVGTEGFQDIAAGLLTSGTHTNITVTYDDVANKVNLAATYGDEAVVDAIAEALTAGHGIIKTYNDVENKINVSVDTSVIASQTYVNTAIASLVDAAPSVLDTLKEIASAINNNPNFAQTVATAITNAITTANEYTDLAITSLENELGDPITGYVKISDVGQVDGVASLGPDAKVPLSQLDIDEKIQDVAAELITSGNHTNVTVTYDDQAGKINFTAVAQLNQEQIQDAVAPLFVHGSNPNISVTYDDQENKMILEAYVPPSKAVMSSNAPSSPIDGQFWFDTDEQRSGSLGALKIWNSLTAIWENITTDLSVSTTNTWTSKNTFNNGIIIGLDEAPLDPTDGQIYYNKIVNKLRIWNGVVWQDIEGGSGGGLSLIPTDTSVPPTTFFVGLVSPPSVSVATGDLWIDVDDDAGSTEFIFAGPNPPAEGTFGTDTLWIDTDEPELPLIYSDNEPPSYTAIEGDFWVDLDDTSGQSILTTTGTPPSPQQTEFWLDLSTEEGYLTYSDLFKDNAAQVTNIGNLPNASNYSGMIAYVSSENSLYVASNGIWTKIYPTYDAEALIWSGV